MRSIAFLFTYFWRLCMTFSLNKMRIVWFFGLSYTNTSYFVHLRLCRLFELFESYTYAFATKKKTDFFSTIEFDLMIFKQYDIINHIEDATVTDNICLLWKFRSFSQDPCCFLGLVWIWDTELLKLSQIFNLKFFYIAWKWYKTMENFPIQEKLKSWAVPDE